MVGAIADLDTASIPGGPRHSDDSPDAAGFKVEVIAEAGGETASNREGDVEIETFLAEIGMKPGQGGIVARAHGVVKRSVDQPHVFDDGLERSGFAGDGAVGEDGDVGGGISLPDEVKAGQRNDGIPKTTQAMNEDAHKQLFVRAATVLRLWTAPHRPALRP